MKKNMLKILIACCVLIAVGVFYLVYAGTGQATSYYGDCIDQKIVQCERKADFIDCKSEPLRKWATMNKLKAEYFKENKKELINEMVAQDLDQKHYKIDYFLNKSFFNNYDRASLEMKISKLKKVDNSYMK